MAVNKTIKPDRIERGQIWSDNNPRSAQHEFIVEDVEEKKGLVHVKRGKRYSTIRIDRLYKDGARGYTYLGDSV